MLNKQLVNLSYHNTKLWSRSWGSEWGVTSGNFIVFYPGRAKDAVTYGIIVFKRDLSQVLPNAHIMSEYPKINPFGNEFCLLSSFCPGCLLRNSSININSSRAYMQPPSIIRSVVHRELDFPRSSCKHNVDRLFHLSGILRNMPRLTWFSAYFRANILFSLISIVCMHGAKLTALVLRDWFLRNIKANDTRFSICFVISQSVTW